MKALVSGAGGFVGRHMVDALETAGYDVTGVDLPGVDVPGGMRFQCDVRQFFESWVKVSYDVVVHCAAVVGGRTFIDGSPLQLAVEDLSLDAALFRWALRARPRRIAYFSSAAAYPVGLQATAGYKLAEDDIDRWHPAPPDQTYGMVKLVGERLAEEANAAGIPTHVFRPFSGYGSDQSLDYPFPAFIDRARRRADPFDVWGDGTQVRDFIHVDDVCAAVMTAIDQDVLGPVNLGTGVATSFLKLASLVIQHTPDFYVPTVQQHPDRPVGVQARVADTLKMTGFYKPKITLEDGIRRALEPA